MLHAIHTALHGAWGRYPRGGKKKLLFLWELPQNKAQIQRILRENKETKGPGFDFKL